MSNVFFGVPHAYGGGIRPRVGVAAAHVVGVHQSPQDELFCWAGTLRGREVRFDDAAQPFGDGGMHPAVAVNEGGTVVAVHESRPPGPSKLHYHVGRVVTAPRNLVEFGDESPAYERGGRPQVALNEHNVVVAVHQVEPGRVRYQVGIADPLRQTISFGIGYAPPNSNGWTPSIAINNKNQVVMVHQGRTGTVETLWYHVGVVDPDDRTISFDAGHRYDTGTTPSVALDDNGFVFEVHEGNGEEVRNLWARIGQVNDAGTKIDWTGASFQYHNGSSPSVGLGGAVAVQINAHGTSLWCTTSMDIDRHSWMADSLDLIGDRRLTEIAMPASHDAGMSRVQNCLKAGSCNTQTQNQSIYHQLRFGCRHFDIRPATAGGDIYTGHFSFTAFGTGGCYGQSMAEALDDVERYLREDGEDLVILQFSHYRDIGRGRTFFTEADMRRLLDLVTAKLKGWLYIGEVPEEGLHSLTVNDYIRDGGKVLAVFDRLESLNGTYPGIYSYSDLGGAGDLVVDDKWANTNDPTRMAHHQLQRLKNREDDGLFLLSWTLTQSKDQFLQCNTRRYWSIMALAQRANGSLWPALVEAYHQGGLSRTLMPNLINTDFIHGAQTDYAVALNREILGRRGEIDGVAA
jgi:hypothetical protein